MVGVAGMAGALDDMEDMDDAIVKTCHTPPMPLPLAWPGAWSPA